jgi:hypothetical protein
MEKRVEKHTQRQNLRAKDEADEYFRINQEFFMSPKDTKA